MHNAQATSPNCSGRSFFSLLAVVGKQPSIVSTIPTDSKNRNRAHNLGRAATGNPNSTTAHGSMHRRSAIATQAPMVIDYQPRIDAGDVIIVRVGGCDAIKLSIYYWCRTPNFGAGVILVAAFFEYGDLFQIARKRHF